MSTYKTAADRPRRPVQDNGADSPSGADAAEPRRRPYRAPGLVEYGRLTAVTRFGGSQAVDSGSASLGPEVG